jgi:hypothetical protein
VPATRKTVKQKTPTPKPTAATNMASVKPNEKAPPSLKTVAAKPKTNDQMVTLQTSASTLEDNPGLLDNLPFQACVELAHRLFTSISFLPSGAAQPRVVLKTVIMFVTEYGSML